MSTIALRPGSSLGRYQLEERLAFGGMGEVWLATARGSGGFEKQLALKVILPEKSGSQQYIELFAQEARLSAKLHHPNLVEVFDFVEDCGVHFLVMEYLPGRSLSQTIIAGRRCGQILPEWLSLKVLIDCCRGLDHAHRYSGIVHCDMSPGNIMLSFAGPTKIVDFGAALESGCGESDATLKGKLAYMAPERILHNSSDRRGDVYSLGVIMYLLFANRLPFNQQQSSRELIEAIVEGKPPRPSEHKDVALDLEQIINRAMAPNPDDRFETASAMAAALSSVLERYARTNLQLEVATHVSSLFPESRHIPHEIRERLANGSVRPRPITVAPDLFDIPTGLPNNEETLSDDDIEIMLDSSVHHAPSGIAELFDAARDAARDAATAKRRHGPRGSSSAAASSSAIANIFEASVPQPTRRGAATIFGSSRKRDEPRERQWPWAKNGK